MLARPHRSLFFLLPLLILVTALVAPLAGPARPASAQSAEDASAGSLDVEFPPIPPVAMYEEVLMFRAEVERRIAEVGSRALQADAAAVLVDSLVSAWVQYGDWMDRMHGDFPNMSRNRPYWLITTDQAADTLTDRLGPVVEAYVRANPDEKVGPVRAEWELAIQGIGVPQGRIFGFHVAELARRGSIVRARLEGEHPADVDVIRDAYLRFLWDMIQLYRQLHATWFDRHQMNVASEDWVIHRMEGRCQDPKWQIVRSFTAVGIDTSSSDLMTDKFMHRLVLADPACGDTVDFVFPLPHYRKMERELEGRTAEERQRLLESYQRDALQRGRMERKQN